MTPVIVFGLPFRYRLGHALHRYTLDSFRPMYHHFESQNMNSRLISGIIAIAYLVAAYLTADGETTFKVGLFLILPLACIWFGEAMGGYTGIGMGRGAITTKTPGCLVTAGGWLLLLIPAIIGLIGALCGN